MTSTAFSADTATDVMHAACAQAGLRSDDAELIRFGENALFHLVSADAVVRADAGLLEQRWGGQAASNVNRQVCAQVSEDQSFTEYELWAC